MSDGASTLREAAPAKINLFLHVVGRRPDGLHLLDSLVVFAALGDVVTVSPGGDISLTRSGPMAGDLPPVEDDLVLRAATRLAQAAGVTAGAAIQVRKNLPVASGIGGGSADAAAAIRALARLWRIDPPPALLAALARDLGADLTVCLAGRPALVGASASGCRRPARCHRSTPCWPTRAVRFPPPRFSPPSPLPQKTQKTRKTQQKRTPVPADPRSGRASRPNSPANWRRAATI